MRRINIRLSTKLWFVLLGIACTTAIAVEIPTQTSIPTDELDRQYLGVGKQESYTYAMLELGIRMGAATSAALTSDTEGATAALASFKEQYDRVRGLVPSWRRHFDGGAIDELGKAVTEGGDRIVKERLIARIEDGCTGCHARFMVPVQARYRWGRFSRISVDSDAGASLDFHTIMLDLSNSLGALRGEVERGSFDTAIAHYDRVKERFTMMELACTACHEEPREYFIDSRVKGRLLRIGGLLRKGSQDTATYTAELNAINEASCLPCHQVHMPAAFLQKYWEENGD